MHFEYRICDVLLLLKNKIFTIFHSFNFRFRRDIALRNCVISSNSNNLVVKLSSIALCKDKHSTEYLRKEGGRIISIRHQAPEILLRSANHTTSSDIYSCAIAIWEILNVGSRLPFDGIANDDFLQLVESNNVDYESLFTDDKIPLAVKNLLVL